VTVTVSLAPAIESLTTAVRLEPDKVAPLIAEAAEQVNRLHFDYDRVTDFERGRV
jgi:hypothetical protein